MTCTAAPPQTQKIRSALLSSDAAASLQEKYDEIYRSAEVWLYQKSQGVHTTVLNLIASRLPGCRLLDVGCGAGRFALMCARYAAEVDGIDFSDRAIEIARLNASCTRTRNTTFTVASAEQFRPTRAFDVVTMIGVIEHVSDPVATLRRIASVLPAGGRLVVSCPGFLNFRGFTYMPLLTLLDFPMSLADLRQVYYWHVRDWAEKAGFEVERCAGALYCFAWDEKGARDMIARVPLAARDRGFPADSLNVERFNRWILEQVPAHRAYLQALIERGVLKRIERLVTLELSRETEVPEPLWQRMGRYINEDLVTDPYWCDQEPFCHQGGEVIHVLRKR